MGQRSGPGGGARRRSRWPSSSCRRARRRLQRRWVGLSSVCYREGSPMANVYPFRPWRYTPQAGPLENLATQPYDTIPTALEQEYRASGPHNLVWLILPGGDYAGAAARLEQWLREG